MPKPTAIFPGGVVTDARLKIATNRLTTTITVAMGAADTSMTVTDATGIVVNSLLSIYAVNSRGIITGDVEIVSVDAAPVGNVLPTITRGYDSTTAAAHASGASVAGFVDAWHHNALVAEVEAIEQVLGANLGSGLFAPSFDFTAQEPGGSLIIGANSITLTPVPQGVNGSDVNHWLYISNGTGTAEAVLIIGGTAVSGAASGTVIVTCANTHTGAWTIGSATSGMQEALQTATAPGAVLTLPAGTFTVYAPVHPPYQYSCWIRGAGRSATVVNVAAGFDLSHAGVFIFSPAQVTATNADSGGISGLTIGFTQPDSTNVGTYTHWPPAVYISGNNHVTVESVIIERCWDAITCPVSNGFTVRNVGMSFFNRGITADQCFDVMSITGVEGWVFGLTVNQTTAFIAVGTNNYLLDLSQVDFGVLDGIISVSGKFAKLQKNGSGGVPMIWGTNIDMDTNGGWEQSNGFARLSNVSVSVIAGTEAFVITGGTFAIDGVAIGVSGATATHFLYNVSQANSGGCAGYTPGVTITNLKLSSNDELGYVVYATTSGAFAGVAHVRVTGAEISKTSGVAYGALFAEATGTGSVIVDLSHIKVSNNGGTAAAFALFQTALNHSISFCDAPGGWDWSAPNSTRTIYNSGMPSVGIPVYANNAAALAGGLTKGQFYRTGADPDPVYVVH